MPRSRATLRAKARALAATRFHTLGDFIPSATRGPNVATAYCQKEGCTCSASVIVDPRPNEIQISGTAVAINCGTNFESDPPVKETTHATEHS